MAESRSADVVALGLAGFRVLDADEVDGELEVVAETTVDRDWCDRCGVRALSKGRPVVVVRDVDAFDRPVRLRWRKRRWRCPEPACDAKTWTEQAEVIQPRLALTERARARACRRVGRDGHSVAAVARDFGVGWHTIMRAVIDHGTPLVEDPTRTGGVRALGVDETSFLRAAPGRRSRFVTGLVDLRRSRLLDVVDGRAGKAVTCWFAGRDHDWLAAIEHAVLAYYRSDGLSNARTEAVNGLMKKVKRVGHGFRNLHNYRLRLLLHCGGITWQDQPAARLRGRAPQIAA